VQLDFSKVTLGDIAGVIAVIITGLGGFATAVIWWYKLAQRLTKQDDDVAEIRTVAISHTSDLREHGRYLRWIGDTLSAIAKREHVHSAPPPIEAPPQAPRLVAIPWDERQPDPPREPEPSWADIVYEAKRHDPIQPTPPPMRPRLRTLR
jgi:hypothetical protein